METTSILSRILSLIFPPYCLHCHEEQIPLRQPLCTTCVSHLEVAPQSRPILVTFERFSPALSLLRELKTGGSAYLAPILAAYMTVHYAQSAHPLPDLV